MLSLGKASIIYQEHYAYASPVGRSSTLLEPILK